MSNSEPRVVPENMLVLSPEEVYAGISKLDLDAIVGRLEFSKPVKLEDLELEDQSCEICRESFTRADDDIRPEQPISLPCGHVFGKECISDWIAAAGGRNSDEHEIDEDEDEDNEDEQDEQDSEVDEEEEREPFKVEPSVGPDHFDDLLPAPMEMIQTKAFTCPKCRQGFTAPVPGKQAVEIESRLCFWDLAYEKLGIVRSAEEEASRQVLWRFVKEMKAEQKVVNLDRMCSFELRARVAAMRFALRRARWELTPLQCYLRDGLFTLGCYGVGDTSKQYCAESYEGLPVPVWCWQFDRIERGLDPSYHWKRGSDYVQRFFADFEEQTLGPWRSRLFAELEEDRLVYQSEEWWDCLYDAFYVRMD